MKDIAYPFNPDKRYPYYFIRKELLRNIKKIAPNLKGKLLDFGCGSKPYKSLFNVDEYIGLDFDSPGHPHDNEDIDVFYNGKNIPFENDYFDCIFCSEVLEHVFNINDVLSEFNRVLKPGGLVFITTPFVWYEHEVPYDFARYTQFALSDIFKKNNFAIQSLEKGGNFLTTIGQLKIAYLHNEYFKKTYFGRKIGPLVYLFYNLYYSFLNIFHSKNYTLYLSTIILARKNEL